MINQKSALKGLQSISLSECDGLSDEGASAISRSWLPSCDDLALPQAHVTAALDHGSLAMHHKRLPYCCRSLTCLDLSWCWSVNDDGLRALLNRTPSLKRLDISGLKRKHLSF